MIAPPGLKDFPHLMVAFDAEISAATRQAGSNGCSKCTNNKYLQIVRKYQKLMEDIKKSQRG